MNRQIQVLYTIFELELRPPFELKKDPIDSDAILIYDKQSFLLGRCKKSTNVIKIHDLVVLIIQKRIKKVFKVDTLSDDDVYHIAKHLVNWFREKHIAYVENTGMWNNDTTIYVNYYKSKDLTHG